MDAGDLTDQQAVDLFGQLPADRRLSVLRTLGRLAAEGRDRRMAEAEERARSLCRQRGLDWNQMSEDQREAFMDKLVHEDRPCGR
jgi:hypothetical protein